MISKMKISRIGMKTNIHRISFYVIISAIVIILVSCGKGGSDSDTLNYDPSVLDPSVSDSVLSIQFRPPLGWALKKSEFSDKTLSSSRANRKSNEKFVFKPTAVFYDGNTRSILTTGIFELSDSLRKGGDFLNDYLTILKHKYGEEELTVRKINNKTVQLNVLQIKLPSIHTYKTLFINSNGSLIQFDYTVPANIADSQNAMIESSMASISSR